MPNARRVCLERTAVPLLLLPVLIAMRGILVVEAPRAAIHVLHALLPVREAHPACVTRAILVMVLRAAIHALHTLLPAREAQPARVMLAILVLVLPAVIHALHTPLRQWEAQPAYVTLASAATASQLVPLAILGITAELAS